MSLIFSINSTAVVRFSECFLFMCVVCYLEQILRSQRLVEQVPAGLDQARLQVMYNIDWNHQCQSSIWSVKLSSWLAVKPQVLHHLQRMREMCKTVTTWNSWPCLNPAVFPPVVEIPMQFLHGKLDFASLTLLRLQKNHSSIKLWVTRLQAHYLLRGHQSVQEKQKKRNLKRLPSHGHEYLQLYRYICKPVYDIYLCCSLAEIMFWPLFGCLCVCVCMFVSRMCLYLCVCVVVSRIIEGGLLWNLVNN